MSGAGKSIYAENSAVMRKARLFGVESGDSPNSGFIFQDKFIPMSGIRGNITFCQNLDMYNVFGNLTLSMLWNYLLIGVSIVLTNPFSSMSLVGFWFAYLSLCLGGGFPYIGGRRFPHRITHS